MRRCIIALAFVLLSFSTLQAQSGGEESASGALAADTGAKVLSFKYREGEVYRILSKVHEDAYLNRRRVNHAEIVNRISVKTVSVLSNGSGRIEATFMTTENSTPQYGFSYSDNIAVNEAFTFGEEFFSRFDRSPTGRYAISDEYFMPVVRDNPIFPATPVSAGDTWEAEGYEAEDLRRTFNIEKPFFVPFNARYKYLGTVDENGFKLDVIDVKYDIKYENPLPPLDTPIESKAQYPVLTEGYSHQTLYWDNEKGEVNHYIEDFRIEIETYYGDRYVFQGIAEAEVEEAKKTNTYEKVEEVKREIEDLGLKDVSVNRGEKGLTINMANIQFMADSTELMDSEKEKLKKIAAIIAQYSNDVLVTGHCALSGSKEAQMRISLERAESVANYLIDNGAVDAYHIFKRGKGAKEAVASNDTEEGRALNRRVEITLMD